MSDLKGRSKKRIGKGRPRRELQQRAASRLRRRWEEKGKAGKEIAAWGASERPGEEGWGCYGGDGVLGCILGVSATGRAAAPGPLLSPRAAVPVACSHAGGTAPHGEGPWGCRRVGQGGQRGQRERLGCCCVPPACPSFVGTQVPFPSIGFSALFPLSRGCLGWPGWRCPPSPASAPSPSGPSAICTSMGYGVYTRGSRP